MTDNEIIRGLKVCVEGCCTSKDCPYRNEHLEPIECMNYMLVDLLNLINRQKAEIERLNKENEKLLNKVCEKIRKESKAVEEIIKAEAIKEFAERLKKEAYPILDLDCSTTMVTDIEIIDNLVKEMVGED